MMSSFTTFLRFLGGREPKPGKPALCTHDTISAYYVNDEECLQDILDRNSLPSGRKLAENMLITLEDFFDVCSYSCYTINVFGEVVYNNPIFTEPPPLASKEVAKLHHQALVKMQQKVCRFNPVHGLFSTPNTL